MNRKHIIIIFSAVLVPFFIVFGSFVILSSFKNNTRVYSSYSDEYSEKNTEQLESTKITPINVTSKPITDENEDEPSLIDFIISDGGENAIKTLEEVKQRIIGVWSSRSNDGNDYIWFYDDGSYKSITTGNNNISVSVEGRYAFASHKELKLIHNTVLFYATDKSITTSKKLGNYAESCTIRLMNYDVLYFAMPPLYFNNTKFEK